MLYDIHLHTVCYTQPEIKDLLARIPALKNPEVQKKLTPYVGSSPEVQKAMRSPGWDSI